MALALLGLSACLSPQSSVCSDNEACVSSGEAGTCEASGYCSFPDGECGTGRRDGQFARDELAAQHSRSGLAVDWFALPDTDPCTT